MSKFVTSKPPIHPGYWVQEELRRRRMIQFDLAQLCGISRFRVNEVVNGKRTMTVESAILIGSALNISAERLMSMQVRYDLYQARKQVTHVTHAIQVSK
jgi:addiction module HigA family antidote